MNIMQELQKPFAESDIEWRISRAGSKNGKTWATCLAYINNRAIQNRLDNVLGVFNWKNEYLHIENGVMCGISCLDSGTWVTKWDGAQETNFESFKGGISDSMKRAAVQWGIGRYLYKLTENFVEIDSNGKYYQAAEKNGKYQSFKWNPPKLPDWALPHESKTDYKNTQAANLVQKMNSSLDSAIGFFDVKNLESFMPDFIIDKIVILNNIFIESGNNLGVNAKESTQRISDKIIEMYNKDRNLEEISEYLDACINRIKPKYDIYVKDMGTI